MLLAECAGPGGNTVVYHNFHVAKGVSQEVEQLPGRTFEFPDVLYELFIKTPAVDPEEMIIDVDSPEFNQGGFDFGDL